MSETAANQDRETRDQRLRRVHNRMLAFGGTLWFCVIKSADIPDLVGEFGQLAQDERRLTLWVSLACFVCNVLWGFFGMRLLLGRLERSGAAKVRHWLLLILLLALPAPLFLVASISIVSTLITSGILEHWSAFIPSVILEHWSDALKEAVYFGIMWGIVVELLYEYLRERRLFKAYERAVS